MNQLMTLSEAALYLRVAPITLYRMARRGDLPAVKLGRGWRFDENRLAQWLQNEEVKNPPETFRHLSTRETKAVMDFMEKWKTRYPRSLKQIILYGSRARGDFKAFSDIDLLFVFQGDKPFLQNVRGEVSDFTTPFNLNEEVLLQPFVMSEEEWKKPSFKTFLLIEKIRREGIALYGSST